MEQFDGERFEREYKRERAVGKGGIGEVFLHIHRETKDKKVVKEVNLKSLTDVRKRYIDRCLSLMPRLNHEHILAFVGCYQPSQMEYRLVFEYMPGSDLGEVSRNRQIPPCMVPKWVRQIALALDYMHQNNFLHRDVKPVNVLLTSSDLSTANAKLADFDTLREGSDLMSPHIGTIEYTAPEVFPREYGPRTVEYTSKCDVWSIGCLTYKLLTGNVPFRNYDEMTYRAGPDYSALTLVATSFVRQCLKFDPGERPAVRELLSDPFLSDPIAVQAETVFLSDPIAVQAETVYVRQVDLAIELVRLVRETSMHGAKTVADNAYRMAMENLEVMEDCGRRHAGWERACEAMRRKTEELSNISEELYTKLKV